MDETRTKKQAEIATEKTVERLHVPGAPASDDVEITREKEVPKTKTEGEIPSEDSDSEMKDPRAPYTPIFQSFINSEQKNTAPEPKGKRRESEILGKRKFGELR